jgi:DNA modification methylase
MTTAYETFLASKSAVAGYFGHDGESELIAALKPHQADICRWAIAGGRRAIFADFGLGKSIMQIQIAVSLVAAYGGSSLIVCPLGVRQEFTRDARRFFGIELQYVRTNEEHAAAVAAGGQYFLTNYERVRDGQLDPNRFTVVSLDEASVLRSFGSKTYQTFLTLFEHVRFKFVCTATPSPNRFKELIHYAGFLGVMDTGQALTRFFQRDSEKAGNLRLYPHKEREFWLWLSTWAVFLTKPSDLGYSDEGYALPPLRLHEHRLPSDHADAGFDGHGQGKLLRDSAISLGDAAREKRDTLPQRIAEAKAIIDAAPPDQHWLIWHDLEDERRAIEAAFPEAVTVYGTQDLDERERAIVHFSDGNYRILATKPILAGSGCNFQRHCHAAVYLGVGYKFNDFIQSVHRINRFLQEHPVDIHVIYSEAEDPIYAELKRKWAQHDELREKMSEIIRSYGLGQELRGAELRRQMGVERREVVGERYTAVNNDSVLEMPRLANDSVDLVVTSWPFSDQYEYTPTYNDFGHNGGDEPFFAQMDYLTPEIVRALKPGRLYCVHTKDRMIFGSMSGDGFYAVNEFSDKCVTHLKKHGLRYMGRITVVTDVVRENNQTYRLGWTEQCKDGTKMGVGSPEYVLLFRKLPTDRTNSYADEPVRHDKKRYTRARWQFDAHGFWRSSGDRFLSPQEVRGLDFSTLRKLWHEFDRNHVYDYRKHVEAAEVLEAEGYLPSSFMLLDPTSHSEMVWDDVVRMRTLNGEQSRRQASQHTCPLQLDIVERLIERYSNPGELVLDPFGGLGTVGYCAVKMGRRAYTIELSPEYHDDAVGYLRAAEADIPMPTLFETLRTEANAS